MVLNSRLDLTSTLSMNVITFMLNKISKIIIRNNKNKKRPIITNVVLQCVVSSPLLCFIKSASFWALDLRAGTFAYFNFQWISFGKSK